MGRGRPAKADKLNLKTLRRPKAAGERALWDDVALVAHPNVRLSRRRLS
jgi:hypothetical protein